MPFLATLFEVDVVVVDDVAICPSSTRLMSLGETGVLTPGPREQVGGLKRIGGQLSSPAPQNAAENWRHEDKGSGVFTEQLHSGFEGSFQSPEHQQGHSSGPW